MQIIRQISDNLVMYVGADLSASEITNLGLGWCDPRVTPILAEVINVGSIPVNFLPDCFLFDGTDWTIASGKEAEVTAKTNQVNTLISPFPTGLAVETMLEYVGPSMSVVYTAVLTWDDMGITINSYESAYREVTDVGWTALPTSSDNFSKAKDLPSSDYYFRVRAISVEGVESVWTEIGPIEVTINPITAGAIITGLEIWGQGNDYNFLGRDPKFYWNRSTNLYVPDLYSVQVQTEWHLCYRVRILNPDDSTRREFFTEDNNYTYTYEDNVADGAGLGPARVFKVVVQDRFVDGTYSAPATITVSNAQMALLDSFGPVTIVSGFGYFKLSWTPPPDIDWVGVRIWGTTFDTVEVGKVSEVIVMADNGIHTVNYAAFDDFGKTGLNAGTVQVEIVDDIAASNVVNWAEEVTRYFRVPAPIGDVWINNNPIAGSVSWNAHNFYFGGIKYFIAAGNTSDPFIYFDVNTASTDDQNPVAYSTTANPVTFEAMIDSEDLWQIVYNDAGVVTKAWLGVANMVVGSAWIRSIVASKIEAGLMVGHTLASTNWGTTEGSLIDLDASEVYLGGSDEPVLEYTAAGGLKLRGAVTVSGSGTEFPIPTYRGAYDAGTVYYTADSVSYLDDIWIYINLTEGAGHTPADDAYWDLYSAGGAGASAYEVWLAEGNTGTEQDFLDSLVGSPGVGLLFQGPWITAYQYYNTTTQIDVVKYLGRYFYAKVSNISQTPPASATSDAYWEYMSSFNSIATDLLLANNATIIVGLTMGDATTDGYIQSYGYSPGVSGWKINGDGTAEFDGASIRGTITAASIKTSSATNYILMNNTNNTLQFYYNSINYGQIYASAGISGTGLVLGSAYVGYGYALAVIPENASSAWWFHYNPGGGSSDWILNVTAHGSLAVPTTSQSGIRVDVDSGNQSDGIYAHGGRYDFYGAGTYSWFASNISALSYTDRTPHYEGDALEELRKVRGKDGHIDHSTLPVCAQRETTDQIKVLDQHGVIKKNKQGHEIFVDIPVPGRDLGAMISILTVGIQQLIDRIEVLESNNTNP